MSISCSSACARVSHETDALRGARATWSASALESRRHARMARSRKAGSTRVSASITPITSPVTNGIANVSTAPLVAGPEAGSRRRTWSGASRGAAARAASPVASLDPSSTTTTSKAGVPERW
jgi:hypothetical protein